MSFRLFLACFALSNLGLGAPVQDSGKGSALANVEVLIVRHAERPDFQDALTTAGEARAKAYIHYFQDLKLNGNAIHLTHLFAEKSVRTRHTLDPLSKALGLPLDTRFTTKQYKELADDLRTHSYGNELLICWHHGNIPDLVRALGGDPASFIPNGKWPQGTYDWLVNLRFDASGKLSKENETLVHEHLMPGDAQ